MSPSKMERFTQRAQRVLNLAQEEAERLHHTSIGTEHVLLGLMREEGGVAGRVLRDLGLEQRQMEELIEGLTRATSRIPPSSLNLSPATKRVLELAVDEARRMGHHSIGTEHILLGLVRQSDGVAIDVLKRLGVSPEEVRRETRRVLKESPTQGSTERQPAPTRVVYPSEASAFSPSATYEFRQTEKIVTKILEMLVEKKITTAQAAELLGGILPRLKLSPGGEAWIGSLVNKPESAWKQRVTLTVKDKDSNNIEARLQLPLEGALNAVDIFLMNAMNNRYTHLVFESSDARKQFIVQIDEDNASRNPPAEDK